jgi:hypothetical protein
VRTSEFQDVQGISGFQEFGILVANPEIPNPEMFFTSSNPEIPRF